MEDAGHPACGELFEAIHALVDEEGECRGELLGHLDGCPQCRGYLDSARATRGALGALGEGRECSPEERTALRECLAEVLRRVKG